MTYIPPQILFFLETAVFVSVVSLHLTKKNSSAVILYIVQSLAVASLLLISSFESLSALSVMAIAATIIVKIVVAPYFFFGLIKKHQLTFSVSTYLNMPVTLLVIAALTALSRASLFRPLSLLAPARHDLLLISFATILLSLFLVINRKGVLSQMLGILSLENGIVSFVLNAGLEQSPGLQIGITFDILIWIIIATVFASMIYKQFGSLDVTAMNKLTD